MDVPRETCMEDGSQYVVTEAAVKDLVKYVVKAKFVGGVPLWLKYLTESDVLYLNEERWSPLEAASVFDSWDDAQSALHDAWHQLRNSGQSAVILSVVPYPRTDLAQKQ